MARLWGAGSELNSTTAAEEWTSTSGSPTISNTVSHGGTYSMFINGLSSGSAKRFHYAFQPSEATGNYYFRFYLRLTTLPSAENCIMYLNDEINTSGQSIYLTLDNAGTLKIYDEDGQITGTTTLSTGTSWYRIEVHYDTTQAGGSQVVELKVDGSVIATASNRDIASTNQPFIICCGGNLRGEAQTTAVWYFDDFAVNDNSGSFQNSYPGEGYMIHLRPNAAGDNAEWSTGTGSSYTELDEVNPDDIATYIQTATNNQITDVNVDATPAGLTTTSIIPCVQVGARHRRNGSSDLASFVLRIKAAASGTVEEGATITPTSTSWATTGLNKLTLYDLPGASTAHWTKTTLDTAQIGVKCTAVDAAVFPNITALWLLVDYKPGAAPTTVLNSPADSATGVSTTPVLDFTGTDVEADDLRYNVQIQTVAFADITTGYSTKGGSGGSPSQDKMWGSKFTTSSVGGTVQGIHCWGYRDLGFDANVKYKLAIVKASDLTIVTNGVSNAVAVPSGANAAAASQMDFTFATAPVLAASTDYFFMAIHNDGSWAVYITYDAGSAGQSYLDSTNSYTTPVDPTDAASDGDNRKYSIWLTYTPTPTINVVSGTDAGFANPDNGGDTDPFNSGENIQYTVQPALANSTQYYWRVRDIDPTANNTYGDFPTARSFTTEAGGGGGTVVKDIIMAGLIPFAR